MWESASHVLCIYWVIDKTTSARTPGVVFLFPSRPPVQMDQAALEPVPSLGYLLSSLQYSSSTSLCFSVPYVRFALCCAMLSSFIRLLSPNNNPHHFVDLLRVRFPDEIVTLLTRSSCRISLCSRILRRGTQQTDFDFIYDTPSLFDG